MVRTSAALVLPGDVVHASNVPLFHGHTGDWSCSKCGNHNYAWRPACNKCGAAKDGATGANGRARSRSRSPVR